MKTKQLLCGCLLCCAVAIYTACTSKQAPAQDSTTDAVETTPDGDAAEGPQYVDFEMPSPYGSPIRVSDYVDKNKYTLIDFWASWCAPCRGEMPTVVKAYQDYHGKGLEIIGVSLDNDHDAWVAAIEALGMSWPQMSDLKGWECEGAKIYNVRSIPANVLVDQQGNIIATDLRGSELLDKMAELMN
jgi:thiol-disulfide isomerase/thioredoxin